METEDREQRLLELRKKYGDFAVTVVTEVYPEDMDLDLLEPAMAEASTFDKSFTFEEE